MYTGLPGSTSKDKDSATVSSREEIKGGGVRQLTLQRMSKLSLISFSPGYSDAGVGDSKSHSVTSRNPAACFGK
jgi:hypothetical protein